jgi:hypothetical protein
MLVIGTEYILSYDVCVRACGASRVMSREVSIEEKKFALATKMETAAAKGVPTHGLIIACSRSHQAWKRNLRGFASVK